MSCFAGKLKICIRDELGELSYEICLDCHKLRAAKV